MTTENRIVGPGYYPRRPTSAMQCKTPLKDHPGYVWWGWYINQPNQSERLGVPELAFVLAKDSASACQYINKVAGTKLTNASHVGANFKGMSNALTGGRIVGVHWPDGSWEIYNNAIATGRQGKNTL